MYDNTGSGVRVEGDGLAHLIEASLEVSFVVVLSTERYDLCQFQAEKHGILEIPL